MITAIVGAVAGLVSGTAAIIKTQKMKAEGTRLTNQAIIDADQQKIQALRQGSRDRLIASRVALVNAQAEQSKLLLESRKNSNRIVLIMAGSSLLLLTVIGLRRRK